MRREYGVRVLYPYIHICRLYLDGTTPDPIPCFKIVSNISIIDPSPSNKSQMDDDMEKCAGRQHRRTVVPLAVPCLPLNAD